jgi:hypothetical protein
MPKIGRSTQFKQALTHDPSESSSGKSCCNDDLGGCMLVARGPVADYCYRNPCFASGGYMRYRQRQRKYRECRLVIKVDLDKECFAHDRI